MVFCTKPRKIMEGFCFECLDSANTYRAEQLGLCAMHHLIAALSILYGIAYWKTRLCCDNLGPINVSGSRLRRIRPYMSCANNIRNIRSARNKMTKNLNYYPVYGRIGDYILDHQLSLEQKTNEICDFVEKMLSTID